MNFAHFLNSRFVKINPNPVEGSFVFVDFPELRYIYEFFDGMPNGSYDKNTMIRFWSIKEIENFYSETKKLIFADFLMESTFYAISSSHVIVEYPDEQVEFGRMDDFVNRYMSGCFDI